MKSGAIPEPSVARNPTDLPQTIGCTGSHYSEATPLSSITYSIHINIAIAILFVSFAFLSNYCATATATATATSRVICIEALLLLLVVLSDGMLGQRPNFNELNLVVKRVTTETVQYV
jgi:hypothetical protein